MSEAVGGAFRGQGTLEYALVLSGVLAAILGLGMLARAIFGGPAAQAVLDSLTHRLPTGVLDAMLF